MKEIHLGMIKEHLPEPGAPVDWDSLAEGEVGALLLELSKVPQNPVYHGEGDVLSHTKMVVEAMASSENYGKASPRQRLELFSAALLHDIGKIQTTIWKDGRWTSPYHAIVGSENAMELIVLNEDCDKVMRDTICTLIRYHMVPDFLLQNPRREAKISAIQNLSKSIPDFSWELLLALCEADTRGRIASDTEECLKVLEKVRRLVRRQMANHK